MNTQETLVAMLSLGLIVAEIAWGDVGPDVLTLLKNGDCDAMRRIVEKVTPAAQEGNRVAQAVICEARTALGGDEKINKFPVNFSTPTGLYEDTEKNWLTAVEKKATDGDPFFMDVLGYLYFQGYGIVPKDQQKAVMWWEKGAELNGGMAKLRLANCHTMGYGVPYDLKKAAVYYREAGELGIPRGVYNLGCLYHGWLGWSPRDPKKAMEYWNKAATMGDPMAQYTLGNFYSTGEQGFPKNTELGMQWMRVAASNGHPVAQSAVSYADNKSVPRTLPYVIEDKSTDIVSTFIAFDKIKENIRGPKISIVCIVDFYDPPNVKPSGPPSQIGELLDVFYLADLRMLERQPTESSGVGTAKPRDVEIFIVECREDTRAKVRELNKQYQVKAYDNTIQAVYVFHFGKLVKTYTAGDSAGATGEELKLLVKRLLAK